MRRILTFGHYLDVSHMIFDRESANINGPCRWDDVAPQSDLLTLTSLSLIFEELQRRGIESDSFVCHDRSPGQKKSR